MRGRLQIFNADGSMNRDPLGEREEEMEENIEAFLTDLADLSREHGIALGGCGCCDSPFLYAVTDYSHVVYEAMPNKRKDRKPNEAIAILLNCLGNGKQPQKGFLTGK